MKKERKKDDSNVVTGVIVVVSISSWSSLIKFVCNFVMGIIRIRGLPKTTKWNELDYKV